MLVLKEAREPAQDQPGTKWQRCGFVTINLHLELMFLTTPFKS